MASARVASVGMEVGRLKLDMQSKAPELGGRMGQKEKDGSRMALRSWLV